MNVIFSTCGQLTVIQLTGPGQRGCDRLQGSVLPAASRFTRKCGYSAELITM